MNERVIVVLGGNAFVRPGEDLTMAGQFRFAAEALGCLEPLLRSQTQLVITHGNGPQVGHMLTRVEEALGKAYAIPLEVCVAESEGEIGYVLQQTLHNLLIAWGCARPIASLLTQVLVDAADPAFDRPTKPIGPFYTAAQADLLAQRGFPVIEDSGRGFRRVVASPRPQEIIEHAIISKLLACGMLVVAAGGGGIPVVRRDHRLEGIEAVVDKDLTSALLGERLGATLMVILTCVPCAYQNYRTPLQEPLGKITAGHARSLLAEGHFAPGSMQPKMEAAVQFADRRGARTIICDPPSVAEALAGRAGTIVVGDEEDA